VLTVRMGNGSRLQTVTDNTGATAHSATYTYLANSPLVSQITFKQGTTTRMTTTKQFDCLNRLLSTASASSPASGLNFIYSYNSANQRIRSTLADGNYWLFAFRKELSLNNTNGPLWELVTVAATGQSSVAGNQFVPKTPEQFYYDADGNLTSDGRWNYTWDAENRLASLVSRTNVGPQTLIKFEYDWQGRRIHKQVWPNTSGTGTPTNDVLFVYDGWNLLAELNATNNAVIRSYLWGADLSGALQGAGGVGGLLKISCSGTQTTNCFVAFDGNGNVAALADAASTNILAQYEYGPFGELLRATGPMATANPFRFSTKYQDDETDLLYYGYRYYNASTGRWLSRDPLEEKGGANLYLFVRNYPIALWDYLGKGLEAGFIFAGDITYDICQGTLSIGGWVWAGAGYELWGVYVGPSYYWQGSYTMTGLPHLQCGKCKCCGEHPESGWNASNIGNIVGPFLGHLGASKNIGIGFIVTPELPCGAEFEGIALVDLLKSGMGGPIITGLRLVAGVLGAEVSAGFDVHVSVHACQTNVGEGIGGSGLTIDSAKIGGGGFVEMGWIPDEMKNRPRH